MGSIIGHLRDPVLALMKVRSVSRGTLMSYEAISRSLSLFHPRMPAARLTGLTASDWWHPTVAALRRLIEAAGFEIERSGGISYVGLRRVRPAAKRLLRHPFKTSMLYLAGIPQVWVVARPKVSERRA